MPNLIDNVCAREESWRTSHWILSFGAARLRRLQGSVEFLSTPSLFLQNQFNLFDDGVVIH